MRAYTWPGNIRELRNLCEHLSILLAGKSIESENLPHEFPCYTVSQDSSDFTLPHSGIRPESLEADLIHQALSEQKVIAANLRVCWVFREMHCFTVSKNTAYPPIKAPGGRQYMFAVLSVFKHFTLSYRLLLVLVDA